MTRMEISDIISAFETAEENELPLAAIREAIAQKEAITPVLLKALDDCAEAHSKGVLQEGDWRLPNFAAFLLASFGEVAAHEKITRLLSMDEDDCEWLWSDEISETGSRLLLSTYPGNPDSMQKLVENEEVYAPARTAAFTGLCGVVQHGLWTVEELKEYITSLFRGRIERENTLLWDEMCWRAAELGIGDLERDISRAFEEELCTEMVAREEHVITLLHGGLPWPDYQPYPPLQPIADAETEIGKWGYFHHRNSGGIQEYMERYDRLLTQLPPLLEPRLAPECEVFPVARTEPKIGRNEPCTCGSGKKYKKCCGVGS